MNINDYHLGIEAFYGSIKTLDTCVLKALSLVNNDWWAATYAELAERRLRCLNSYFPMVQDGYLHLGGDTPAIHIDDTCISTNAFLKIGKLLRELMNRKPYSKHPSYECLYHNEIFIENALNESDADMRFFNTLYFILGCATSNENPVELRNQILCNVCMAYLLLQYMLANAAFDHSKRILKNRNMKQAISEKLSCLRQYLRHRYLPADFKQQILQLIVNMQAIGF